MLPARRGPLERLRPSDYEAVLDFTRRLYAIGRVDGFAQQAITGLARLIPSDIITYNEVDPKARRATALEEPAGAIPAASVATLGRLAHEHPLITHYAQTRESQPLRISDFLSLTQFRKLDLHNELFRPLRVNYQLAVTIPSPPELVIGITFNRSQKDFSERDRALLTAIRPHLVQAHRNAAQRATLQQRAETAERALWSAPSASLATLTSREHEVLVLMADGKTNLQIADLLLLSPRTVQKHLEHVYDKLGVRTRTAAAMKLSQAS
jgi:DNA-binding CsgD family transcriptional regulator